MKTLLISLLGMLLAGSAFATAPPGRIGGVVLRADAPAGDVREPGDRVSFELQSASDAAVVVFGIDTQGYVSLLYPSGAPDVVSSRRTVNVPDDGSELFVEGEPGVEFVFAMSVDDVSALNVDAIEALRAGQSAAGGPRRVTGDPFIAANMIAADLVDNISAHAVAFGYTWFYVSERVEYPCYLCGGCEGDAAAEPCGYSIRQNFDRRATLTYPLRRGYEMEETGAVIEEDGASPSEVALPDDDQDVVVNFYPYGSEVRYADPFAVNLWYDWGWYDPFWYYPYYYPYCDPYWSISFGFGWGWGWGGYYCSGWYDPWYGYGCGGYYPYYPDDPYYGGSAPEKFKTKYKSGGEATNSLASNRSYAAKHDGDLRVASRNVRSTPASKVTSRSKYATGASTRTGVSRVKTSVSGSRGVVGGAFSKWRSTPGSKSYAPGGSRGTSPSYRSKGTAPQGTGRSVIQRGGSRTKGGSSVAPNRSTPTKSPARGSTPQMRSSSPSRSAPAAPSRSGGVYRGGASSRGGGSKGGGRGR